MRLTNRLMADSSIDNINQNLEKLYQLGQQAATGRKYARPSDNPAETTQTMDLTSTLRQMETYQNTMASTQTWLDATEKSLNDMNTYFIEAQTAVMKGLNETLGADERKVLANEIDGIIKGMVDTLNVEDRGRYIFSGLKTDVKPFTLSTDTVEVTEMWVNVQANMDATATPPTMTVNGVTVYPSETTAGSGIYLLSPTTTPASPLPGITLEADTNSSPVKYSVNGTDVDIVAGNPSYPGITTNVKIDIPPGDADYPTYKTDTVLYNGDENNIQRYIAPNEMLNVSINGGAFGLTPYTDTTTNPSTTFQTSDLFNTLIRVRDVLNNADYVSPHTLTSGSPPYTPLINTSTLSSKTSQEPPDRTLLKEAYGMLKDANDGVSLQLTYLGGRMKQIANTIDRMDNATLEVKALISQKSEVNLAEAISEVQNQSTVYQAVLNISGRTNTTLTLFDTLK